MIELENTFRVNLPVKETWELLSDLPRVATCLPGARLDEVVDGQYRGGMSTKVGPINARYSGVASFVEYDEVGHRAVIEARGREEKGSGSASATITATLLPDGDDATQVHVSTSMAISGRAAQFGRSLLAEVSTTLVGEFVRRLEAMIQQGGTAGGQPGAGVEAQESVASDTRSASPEVPSSGGTRSANASSSGDENTLDVLSTVVLPLLRRSALPGGAALVAALLGFLFGRRSRRSGRQYAAHWDGTYAYLRPDSRGAPPPFGQHEGLHH